MKKNYRLSSFVILLFFFNSLTAQIFVKSDAGGANNGTSWTDAYTDLTDALNASTVGDQIWVAAGTYKPGGMTPDTLSFFTFPHDLSLYGGFVGTETMLSERDWDANETILSGDHSDNDVDNDFDGFRGDNSLHVMWLTDTVTTASTVDGFTISNGNTHPGSGSGDFRRGGGILTYGAPAIRNCTFSQNYGYFGGSVYPRGGGANHIIIEDCIFDNNFGGFGGGIYMLTDTATVNDCEFIGNVADNGGTGGRGGAVYNSSSESTFMNCDFSFNSAPNSSGGAIMIRSGDNEMGPVNIVNCTFDQNTAAFGGAFGSYDPQSTANLANCDFTKNTATTSGGATTNGFGSTSNFTDCIFSENEAGNGGSLYSQNDSATITIINCNLSLNAANRGGAINISGAGEPLSTTPIPVLTVENTFIQNNLSAEQGAGVNIANTNAVFKNVLLENNFITDPALGIGGGISINTNDSIDATVDLINCTVVNNSGAIGAGISHWKLGDEGTSVLTLQNSVFNNLGNNYEIEEGTPTLISSGGNLSTDLSMLDELVAVNDLSGEDALFVDFDNEDYHLANGSPCIDAGIETGAPLLDIEGLPRVDGVDMGAFENQKLPDAIFNLSKSFGELDIFPNPVQDDLNFVFESSYNGDLVVKITDIKGVEIMSFSMEKNTENISRVYNVTKLPKGIYQLVISNGTDVDTKAFVK